MAVIADMRKVAVEEGYIDENADAKVCQDIVLKALAESTLSRNVTIKGGVAMRGLSNDARRATQYMDAGFLLDDNSAQSSPQSVIEVSIFGANIKFSDTINHAILSKTFHLVKELSC